MRRVVPDRRVHVARLGTLVAGRAALTLATQAAPKLFDALFKVFFCTKVEKDSRSALFFDFGFSRRFAARQRSLAAEGCLCCRCAG